MELITEQHFGSHFRDLMIDQTRSAHGTHDRHIRYRSIVGQLDVLIEVARREPGCNLKREMDHLLNEMLEHVGSENEIMELVRYPQATPHRIHHHYICETTDELRSFVSNGQNVQPDKLDYIRLLWLVHNQMHDQALEGFLASQK